MTTQPNAPVANASAGTAEQSLPALIAEARWVTSLKVYPDDAAMMPAAMSHQKVSDAWRQAKEALAKLADALEQQAMSHDRAVLKYEQQASAARGEVERAGLVARAKEKAKYLRMTGMRKDAAALLDACGDALAAAEAELQAARGDGERLDLLIEWLGHNDDVQEMPCRDWGDNEDARRAIDEWLAARAASEGGG